MDTIADRVPSAKRHSRAKRNGCGFSKRIVYDYGDGYVVTISYRDGFEYRPGPRDPYPCFRHD
jgi:hypothetical protein